MTVYHPELAAGRWEQFTLLEQMANVGSEVERALKWKEKNNSELSMKAFDRALELLGLTLGSPRNRGRLKEIARTKEVLLDFFYGQNQFAVTAASLRKYFLEFACAACKNVGA